MTTTRTRILPHALPGFSAWLREQAEADLKRCRDVLALWEPLAGCEIEWQPGSSSALMLAQLEEVQDRTLICEAHLTILGVHKMVVASTRGHDIGPGGAERIWKITVEDPTLEQLRQGFILSPGDAQPYCKECRALYPCKTVRLLASGYSRRPGYENGWTL